MTRCILKIKYRYYKMHTRTRKWKLYTITYFHKFKNSIRRLLSTFEQTSIKIYRKTHTHTHTENSSFRLFYTYAMQYDIVISYNVYTVLSMRKDQREKKTLFYRYQFKFIWIFLDFYIFHFWLLLSWKRLTNRGLIS